MNVCILMRQPGGQRPSLKLQDCRYINYNYGYSQVNTDLVYRDNDYGGIVPRNFYHMAGGPAL